MMDKDFNFKCSLCGLCQDDDKNGDYICKEDNETKIDLFEDENPELLKTPEGLIYRFTAICGESFSNPEIEVNVDSFYSINTIYSALGTYCQQEEGLEEDLLELGSVSDGNGKWKDVFFYDGQRLGHWLAECVKKLDEIKGAEKL